MSLQPVSNGADDARIAHFEREENFRWIANVLATTSSVTLKERVPEHIQQAIYSFAEFAEIAHGSFDPVFILNDVNRRILGATGFPLEHYPTLTGEIDGQLEHLMLTQRFQGLRGSLQGYCCLRMHPRTPVYDANSVMNESSTLRPQIVLAFSGTSNARLVMYDIMATPTAYKSAFNYPSKPSWRVHDGFQRVYQGIKSPAFKSLRDAITAMEERTSGPWDLIITAHSLGAAVGYLTLLDLLHHVQDPDTLDSEVPILPNETNITICVFGSPRVANASLVDYFRQLTNEWRQERGRAEALTEWSIIGHRDGVSSLPPAAMGYSHFCAQPYYSFGGHLYSIPPSESEHGHFNVDVPEDQVILHPRGGHNYYGGRDIERLQRRLKAITLDLKPSAPLSKSKPSRARSMYGDTQHSISNSNLFRRATARVIRRASWTANEDDKTLSNLSPSSENRDGSSGSNGSNSSPSGNRDGSGGSSGPAPDDVEDMSMQLTSEPEQEWARRYLERERKEEETWQQRLKAQAKPSTLGRLASLKVFKRR